MGTTEYLDKLNLAQLRYARDEADRRIKKAEETPKKIVWIVTNGVCNISWHREEDYTDAIQSYLEVLQKEDMVTTFKDMIEERSSVYEFKQWLPEITALYQNELEYEEWFSASE